MQIDYVYPLHDILHNLVIIDWLLTIMDIQMIFLQSNNEFLRTTIVLSFLMSTTNDDKLLST